MRPGDVVVIGAFDEVPEHCFQVEDVLDDFITGVALTGPLQGEYGEPELHLVVRVLSAEEVQQGTDQSQQA
jgi:hypothetical protein